MITLELATVRTFGPLKQHKQNPRAVKDCLKKVSQIGWLHMLTLQQCSFWTKHPKFIQFTFLWVSMKKVLKDLKQSPSSLMQRCAVHRSSTPVAASMCRAFRQLAGWVLTSLCKNPYLNPSLLLRSEYIGDAINWDFLFRLRSETIKLI